MTSNPTPKKSKNERGQNIQVFVRVRPLNSSEKLSRSISVVETKSKEVIIKEKVASKTFSFDQVFGPNSKQTDVYKSVVDPLIEQVLQGYNCTVFAYGQTGTGKTYTMEGSALDKVVRDNDPESGIIPRSLSDIFDELRLAKVTDFAVRVSFLELYNEEIFDLLSGENDATRLRLYEDSNKKGSVIIQGLEEVQVHSKAEVYRILERGSIKRQTAATLMNANSSRSHTVFTVTVLINTTSVGEEEMIKIGKLNLVDLAGSENIGRSGAIEKRAREAGNINQSLLTLGRVITSLVDRTPHVPYRESKLTRLLQDSLGGRTKTSIIATVSPAAINLEETLSTLDYAHRAKNITNKPEVNQKISKKTKLLEYTEEIDKLKAELHAAREKDGVFLPSDTYSDLIRTTDVQNQEITNLVTRIKVLEEETEKLEEMFISTKNQLEESEKEREETLEALTVTRDVLVKTTLEKEESNYLITKHIETEIELSHQARELLTVSQVSTEDLKEIHNKLERKRCVEENNEKISLDFTRSFSSQHSKMNMDLNKHGESQKKYGVKLKSSLNSFTSAISSNKLEVSESLSQMSNSVSSIISDLEKTLKSNFEYESGWSLSVMEDVEREKTELKGSLVSFLEDSTLPQLRAISEALVCQRTSVNELAETIDVIVKAQEERMTAFVVEQESLKKHLKALLNDISNLRDSDIQGIRQINRSNTESTHTIHQKYLDMQSIILEKMKSFETEFKNYEETTDVSSKGLHTMTKSLGKTDNDFVEAFNSYVTSSQSGSEAFIGEQSSEINRLQSRKLDVIDVLSQKANLIASAVEALSMNSKEMVSSSTECLESHCIARKSSLKEKSQRASENISEIQKKAGDIEMTISRGKTAIDSKLESQTHDDGVFSEKILQYLAEQSEDVQKFSSALERDLSHMDSSLTNLFTIDLQKDVSTGKTPSRSNIRSYPKEIYEGTPDQIRLERFRKRNQGDAAIPEYDIGGGVDDTDSVYSVNTMASEDINDNQQHHNLSRQNSQTLDLSQMSSSNEDEENKDPSNEKFIKPKVSKIKKPDIYPRSRSGSRSRTALGTSN